MPASCSPRACSRSRRADQAVLPRRRVRRRRLRRRLRRPGSRTCAGAGRSPTRPARPSRSPRLLGWLAVAHQSIGVFVYTLFGFRLQLLHTLAGSDIPLHVRLQKLEEPIWDSGLVIALGAALVGLYALRKRPRPGRHVLRLARGRDVRRARRRELLRALPDRARAGQLRRRRGRARSRAQLPIRIVVLGAVLALALPTAREGAQYESDHPLRHSEVGVARLRPRARPPGRHRLRHVRAAQRRLLRRACGTPTRTCGA